MLESLASRLASVAPTITDILKASGCPGASVGILHEGQVLYTQGFGFRDVEKELPPDEHTTYYLSSLSKTFTASMVATLVERGKLEWTTPVSKILPGARHWDSKVRSQANIVDYLSHRTGLAPKNNIWNAEFAYLTMPRSEALPVHNHLEKLAELRTRYQYNNWGYAVAEEVITALSGEFSWGTALKKEIFDPLGMTRTITSRESKIGNRAEAYIALSDGTPYHVPHNGYEDGKLMAGAVAVQSSVHDLLLYYSALLKAYKEQTSNNTTKTDGSPLVQVPFMLKGHIECNDPPNEHSYALAWARTTLPAATGFIGLNPTYVKMPIVGKGIPDSKLCFWHQGSCNTFLSSVFLLPDTETAVVVLTNALAQNDVADWIGQLLMQTVLDSPEKTDYLELAKTSSAASMARWPKIKVDLDKERVPNTSPKSLNEYVGQYYNKAQNFYLDIKQDGDSLTLSFQGNQDQVYQLEHYNYDVFTWVLTREETAHRGRFPVTWRAFYKLLFQPSSDDSNKINSVLWENDGSWESGEIYLKKDSARL